MRKIALVLVAVFLMTSCNQAQDCKNLPQTFTSYKDAINKVKNSTFKLTDEVNTSRSSWITSAKYYSCDGNTGYFIYTTNKGYEYIHKGVPINIWNRFKDAPSFGSFYDAYIKHRYQLIIN